MRTLGSLLTLSIFVLAVGCGSSDSKKPDSGGGIDAAPGGDSDAPAVGGIDTPAGEIDVGGAVACNLPSCVAPVLSTCQPAGACVSRAAVDAGLMAPKATCFANGVKVVNSTDLATLSLNVTYKSGNATCYSVSVTLANPPSYTIKDATGVSLGSGTYDSTTGAVTFACSNGAPVVLNAACNLGSLIAASGATATCTDGVCDP